MKKTALEELVVNKVMQTGRKCRIDKITTTEKVVVTNDTSSQLTKLSRRRRDTTHDNIIRPRDLPQFLGISRTSCWRLSKDSLSGFPAAIRISNGTVGYFRHELLAWLESRQRTSVVTSTL